MDHSQENLIHRQQGDVQSGLKYCPPILGHKLLRAKDRLRGMVCSWARLNPFRPAAKFHNWRKSAPPGERYKNASACSSTFHPYFSFSFFDQSIQVFFGLRHAQDFFDRGLSRSHLVPAVRAQGAHPIVHGPLRDGRGWRAVQNQRPHASFKINNS